MTVYKPAYVMLSYGEKVPVVVKNMNSTGLRIEFFQNTTLGERVQIVEPSIPLRAWAEVVWERNGASGLRLIDTG
ncbi:MAG: hypothetical protein Q8R02_19020 [Hyphomonadaceae bacterium]|nr:hypothetical protein [Hyphomonadaceae bacterium]